MALGLYVVLVSGIGALALVTGVIALIAGSAAMLAALAASMGGLWVIATARHMLTSGSGALPGGRRRPREHPAASANDGGREHPQDTCKDADRTMHAAWPQQAGAVPRMPDREVRPDGWL